MVLSACVCTGCVMAQGVKKRIEELIYLKKIMLMFQGEVRYKNAMLSEGFLAVSLRAKEPYNSLFERLSEATENNNSSTMADVFDNEVEDILTGNTYLNGEDIKKLKELGETMGYQDQKMQLANIDLYIERLSSSIDEDKGKMNETMKVYRTLGIMAGIMITIVLI